MQAQGVQPDMPQVEATHLLDYLFEVGPTMAAGMGAAPVTFGELDAWCNRVGIDLSPWESRALRQLSRNYVDESYKAEKRDCPPPWTPKDMTEENRAAVSRQVEMSLRAIALAQKGKP